MADGSFKNIDNIQSGDVVLAKDGLTDIVSSVHDISEEVRTLWTINNRIVATESHPFLTEEGWKSNNSEASKALYSSDGIEVGKLSVGDNLVSINGLEKVESLSSEEKLIKVYDYNIITISYNHKLTPLFHSFLYIFEFFSFEPEQISPPVIELMRQLSVQISRKFQGND